MARMTTGSSGQYAATLDPAKIPGAVALLMQERQSLRAWRNEAEEAIAALETHRADDRLFIAQRFAELQERIVKAEAGVKSFLVALVGIWTVLSVLAGLWISYTSSVSQRETTRDTVTLMRPPHQAGATPPPVTP